MWDRDKLSLFSQSQQEEIKFSLEKQLIHVECYTLAKMKVWCASINP